MNLTPQIFPTCTTWDVFLGMAPSNFSLKSSNNWKGKILKEKIHLQNKKRKKMLSKRMQESHFVPKGTSILKIRWKLPSRAIYYRCLYPSITPCTWSSTTSFGAAIPRPTASALPGPWAAGSITQEMLIITLKQKQEREEGGNPLGILKQSLGNPEVASGQGPGPTGRCCFPNLITTFWEWKKR